MSETSNSPSNYSVLKVQVDRLLADTNAVNEEVKNIRKDHVTREEYDALLTRINNLGESVARLSERLTLFQAFQAILSTALAAAAAFLGRSGP